MGDRRPKLEQLEALVGEWQLTASIDGRTLGTARASIEWLGDRDFLVERTAGDASPDAPPEWRVNSPLPTTRLIGLDDATGELTVLHADARGVRRVYRMLFGYPVWTVWRDAPGFHQRFTGVFSDDGRTIEGRWDKSDDGRHWQHDFVATYRRTDRSPA